MSTLYNLEPQPTAKVLLKTTGGDILLELFAKQTPLASRNFLQHCLDGYYDGTVFHRLVPEFIIQGGDPTGTGSGGESVYDGGEAFADEFHSRLKFNRRGLLGMANGGRKDDNGSQFFLTLGKTEELTGKNTMFGRVVGDTIFNLVKMGEAELAGGDDERPLYPIKVTGSEILVNPFEDMVKKVIIAPRLRAEKLEKKTRQQQSKRKVAKALLSFGAEDGDGDENAVPVIKKMKFNPKLVSAGDEQSSMTKDAPLPTRKAPANGKSPTREREISPSHTRHSPPREAASKPKISPRPSKDASKIHSRSPPPSSPDTSIPGDERPSLLDQTNEQIATLKASMRRTATKSSAPVPRKKSTLESMVPATATKGRKRRLDGASGTTAEEKRALDLFNTFRNKLDQMQKEPDDRAGSLPSRHGSHSTQAMTKENGQNGHAGDPVRKPDAEVDKDKVDEEEDDEAALCDLHFIVNCQSCTKWNADGVSETDENDTGWMSHSLSFAKDILGKSLEWKRKNEQELVVIDPREKAKELKLERKGKGDRDEASRTKASGRWEKDVEGSRRR